MNNGEISGSNALNKSMQGLWTNHRRPTKLNLNNPVTPEPVPEQVNGLVEVDSQAATPKRRARTQGSETSSKRARLAGVGAVSKDHTPPEARLADLGGIEPAIEKCLELIALPLLHPEIYAHTGVAMPRGVLIFGPPGCGKTMLAGAIAGELGVPFLNVSAPSVVSGMSGESEKTLRDTFDEAKRVAPSLLFIDEIDAITPKRESAQREMERRIVAQFLTCMDDLAGDPAKPVIVIGATNRPDSLDSALRRAGRFDHEIGLGVPNEEARIEILKVQCAKLRLSGDFDFAVLAKRTPGFVGADLASLCGAAGVGAVKRIWEDIAHKPDTAASQTPGEDMAVDTVATAPPTAPIPTPGTSTPAAETDQLLPMARFAGLPSSSISQFLNKYPTPLTPDDLAPISITLADFLAALPTIQPSSLREGFATIPDVTWADVGALHSTRDELHMAIVEPIKRPKMFEQLGVSNPVGVLMWGPPGCGKTLLAKAVANASRANFISVKGPELLNKYVGESERAVRTVFARARASCPCVVFFDELDALVPRRDDSLSESSARVVNTLLTELDGLDARKGVYVIGATNRPDMIDPAMCRPGRLDKLLYVDLPTPGERVEIIRTVIRKTPLADGVYDVVARVAGGDKCDGFSGADLTALVREAAVCALRRTLRLASSRSADGQEKISDDNIEVTATDFEEALRKVTPSVSPHQRRRYNHLKDKFGSAGLPDAAKTEATTPTKA